MRWSVRIGLSVFALGLAAVPVEPRLGDGAALTANPGAEPSRVSFGIAEEFVFEEGTDPYWFPRNTSFYSDELWGLLAELRVPIYLHLGYQRDFGPVPPGQPARTEVLGLAAEMKSRGIPMWAWYVVPYSEGKYAWEGNADLHLEALDALAVWAREHGLPFEGVLIDPESPLQDQAELWGFFANPAANPTGMGDFFHRTVNPARQCEAIRKYQQLVDRGHDYGLKMASSPFPMVLDDLVDGMIALQDVLEAPSVPPFGWDEMYFMAYRSQYAALGRRDPGPSLVASYYQSASHRFGDAGLLALGVVGIPPYDDLDTFIHDVRVVASLGAKNIPIYSLELTLAHFGLDGLRKVVEAGERPLEEEELRSAVRPSLEAIGMRSAMVGLDAVAAAATPISTADSLEGPQLPNRYPDGCETGWVPIDKGGKP